MNETGRIVYAPGTVAADDEIELLERPAHDLTIRDIVDAYHGDDSSLARMLDNRYLSEAWIAWAHRATSRHF